MAPIPQENKIANEMYEAASRARGESRNYLGMSQIGDPCKRKIWFGFRGYTSLPLDGRAAMIFDIGNRVEDAVIHWLKEAGYQIDSQQLDFSAHNGFFKGHCDGIIHGVTSRPHILEIKSANEKKFKAFKENGIAKVSPTYYGQVQCYMGYSGLERALWVVMNKNTCEIYTERCYFNREDFNALHQKAAEIIKSSIMPQKTESSLCEWCDFRLWCQEPLSAMQTAKTCGTCHHCLGGIPPTCSVGDRELKRWGMSCNDWQFWNPHML